MSDLPIHEPNRYVRQLQDRIREQRELLDECERAMREVERLVLGANHSQTRYPYFLTMLTKLRAAQEKGR